MSKRVGVVILLLAVTLVVAGCTEKPKAPEDPEAVAAQALRTFGASLGSDDGGALSRIEAEMQMNDDGGGGMDFGMGAFDMLMEWGKNDIVHVRIGVADGGFSLNLDAWCTPDGNYLQWGADVYVSRPVAEGQDDGPCGMEEDFNHMDEGFDIFSDEGFGNVTITNVETHSDGSITAHFEMTDEGGGTGTADIDSKGRLTRLTMDSPEATGTFEISYGKRATLEVPEATGRLPADVDWSTEWTMDDTQAIHTFQSAVHNPPLSEIEARMVDYDWENDEDTIRATFALDAGSGSDGGYTFSFDDADGDGLLTDGDTLTVTLPAGTERWEAGSLEIFDEWAGLSTTDNPMPAPGTVAVLALTLVGLLGVALVRRRA